MYLPTLSHRFAPDDGRVTDKQHDTRQDTQKAAGELQGRARRDEHTEDRTGQDTGTGRRKGTQQDTQQPRNTQQEQEDRRTSRGKAGREGHGWPCAWGSGGGGERRGDTAAGRDQGENRQTEKKRYINI